MFSRILSRTTQLRLLTVCPPQIPKYPFFRHFSTNNNGGDDDNHPASRIWNISQQDDDVDDIFGSAKTDPFESEKPKPVKGRWVLGETDGADDFWLTEGAGAGTGTGVGRRDITKAAGFQKWNLEEEKEKDSWPTEGAGAGAGTGAGAGRVGRTEKSGFQQWSSFKEEEEKEKEKEKDLFGEDDGIVVEEEDEKSREEREMKEAAEKAQLQQEKRSLLEVIQGPNRAFGDLIAASGITDDMLDSLIALKNFQGIQGLPPLSQIEDERYLKTLQKSSRHEMELQKQEDIAKARVRKVDEQERAYGTGKRKTSIARVWIEPGEGKFRINDKEFDVYFPMLDHRAALLRPFSETKTLGLWDIKCTVKGGGTTGQVGAIRLGISRALQNWEPGLRPPLREAGFLTRDSRIVERKKPGKAKARKSFQWVKR